MTTEEVQMDGFTYELRWVHSGQYHPYGDSFYVVEIKTNNTNPDAILKLMKDIYGYDVPLKKDWNSHNIDEYFRGYCEVKKIDGGFCYTKCEPYTD